MALQSSYNLCETWVWKPYKFASITMRGGSWGLCNALMDKDGTRTMNGGTKATFFQMERPELKKINK
jgi:hypothetical protein